MSESPSSSPAPLTSVRLREMAGQLDAINRMVSSEYGRKTLTLIIEELQSAALAVAGSAPAPLPANFHAIVGPNGMCLCGVKPDGSVVTCGALLEAYIDERVKHGSAARSRPPTGSQL